jgi:hypothetical protein
LNLEDRKDFGIQQSAELIAESYFGKVQHQIIGCDWTVMFSASRQEREQRKNQKRHGLHSAAGGRNQIGTRFKGRRPELCQPGAAPQAEENSKKSRAESPFYN